MKPTKTILGRKERGNLNYIENNTWVRGNTRFISSVEHDIMLNIMFNTRNKSGISKHPYMYFSVYYINYRFSTNIKCPEAMIGDCLKSHGKLS